MDEKRILMERAYEKLEVAKSLLENEFYSDAVSRAYYAMFYAARALLSEQNIYPKTHHGVISQFGLKFVKEVGEEEISVQLKGKDVELFDAIREIQVGGERIYGFGRLELRDKPRREVNKILAKYVLDLTANRLRVKSEIALAHVMMKEDEDEYFDKLANIRGDLEPLVWREWSDKGTGQKPQFEGIALVPGSRFDLNEMEIGPYGILKHV